MKEPYKIPYNINSINDYKAKGIVNTKCVIVKKNKAASLRVDSKINIASAQHLTHMQKEQAGIMKALWG